VIDRTLPAMLACLLLTASSFACGPYFESGYFGWHADGSRYRTRAGETADYIEQLLWPDRPSQAWSDQFIHPCRGRATADDLAIYAHEMRSYLAQQGSQPRRAGALWRLELIERHGAADPESCATLLADPENNAADLVETIVQPYAMLALGWKHYARAGYPRAIELADAVLETTPDDPVCLHFAYLRARAWSRSEPKREVEAMAAFLDAHGDSPLRAEAIGWLAHGLLAIDRVDDAMQLYGDLCVDPDTRHMFEASALSIGRVLQQGSEAGRFHQAAAAHTWLRPVAAYHAHHVQFGRSRDPRAATKAWSEFSRAIREEHRAELPHRAIELAAVHHYEAGDYERAIGLWLTLPPEALYSRSRRMLGIALASEAAIRGEVSLELAEAIRSSTTLHERTERWIFGEMGRRLLDQGRRLDAIIAFRRGGFIDADYLIDLSCTLSDLRALQAREGLTEEHPDLRAWLGRQYFREGRYREATTYFDDERNAWRVRAVADAWEAHALDGGPETMYDLGRALYETHTAVRDNRYLGWRARYAAGYGGLGLISNTLPHGNPHRRAIEWFDLLASRWPDHPKAADALYWSAVSEFWTSDWDWYWRTWSNGAAGAQSYGINPEFIDRGADRLRRFLDRYPDHELAAQARRRLTWAEGILAERGR
jgi:tetratricopeptide (TPR) repeat protein